MLYALLFYGREDDWERLDRAERRRIMDAHLAELNEANSEGALITSVRLLRTDSATTVRAVGERASVWDGPFAETKEQLGGFQVLDCENLDAAIRYATVFAAWGAVEVRPVHPEPGSLD
jgi:hypothetical protein